MMPSTIARRCHSANAFDSRKSLLRLSLWCFAFIAVFQFPARTASGQSELLQPSLQAELSERVESLERALESALKQRASLDFAEQQSDKEEDKVKVEDSNWQSEMEKLSAGLKKDNGIEVPSDKWNVKLGGHLQLDYITWPAADPAIAEAENYFNYRRLRLVADGVGYGMFEFRLQMTLEPGQGANESPFATPDVKDAYVSMLDIPWIGKFRIGNFFVPFGLEQVTNDTNNLFNERSIPTQGIFTADREVGIAFYNCTPDKNITWCGGLFFDSINDSQKTRFGDSQGRRLSGRLTWLPYYDEQSNGRYLIHTGAGVLYTDDHDNLVRFAARPQIQRGPILIDTGNVPADSYTTGNLELAIVAGRFTLQNEAFLSQVNALSGSKIHTGGAYSHLSWFLTGESRAYERFGQHGAQFGRNRPFTNFNLKPGEIGWGAWEAKARWSYLDLTDNGNGQYNDLTAGLNWYWSDRTRIMFDWIRPMTSSDTVFGSTQSDLFAMRFDANW